MQLGEALPVAAPDPLKDGADAGGRELKPLDANQVHVFSGAKLLQVKRRCLLQRCEVVGKTKFCSS